MSNWSTKVNVIGVTSNPLMKIINLIYSISLTLAGCRQSGQLVDENDYIVVNTKRKSFYIFNAGQETLKIAKSKISGIRVSNEKKYFIFRSTVCEIFASGVSADVKYEVKCSYKEIKEKADSWLG
tara:strand:- start:1111 stop:1485 length:375 start_codon:yes stop_codon:yes gene_type:complete